MLKKCRVFIICGLSAGLHVHADYPAPVISGSDQGTVYVLDYTKQNERLVILKELIKEGSVENFKERGVSYIANLDYFDLESLKDHCAEHVTALEIALELHTQPELYDLMVKMHQEIKAMPAQPKPQPGHGFTPNIYRYIDAKRHELKTNAQHISAIKLHERALELLPYLRHEALKRVITAKKIMSDKTALQIDAYVVSEKERLNAISEMIKEELQKWEYFEEPDLLGWTDGRCGFRKKVQ